MFLLARMSLVLVARVLDSVCCVCSDERTRRRLTRFVLSHLFLRAQLFIYLFQRSCARTGTMCVLHRLRLDSPQLMQFMAYSRSLLRLLGLLFSGNHHSFLHYSCITRLITRIMYIILNCASNHVG